MAEASVGIWLSDDELNLVALLSGEQLPTGLVPPAIAEELNRAAQQLEEEGYLLRDQTTLVVDRTLALLARALARAHDGIRIKRPDGGIGACLNPRVSLTLKRVAPGWLLTPYPSAAQALDSLEEMAGGDSDNASVSLLTRNCTRGATLREALDELRRRSEEE